MRKKKRWKEKNRYDNRSFYITEQEKKQTTLRAGQKYRVSTILEYPISTINKTLKCDMAPFIVAVFVSYYCISEYEQNIYKYI